MNKLGFYSIVLLTINSVIGTGIFLSPGGVAKLAGSLAPQIYIAAAIFAAVLSVTFASASKYVVKSGAAYAYCTAGFGKNVGLYVGVTRFVAASIAWGVMATGVIKVSLQILGLDSADMTLVTVGFLVLMAVLLLVNLFGPKFFAFVSNLSTIGKLLALFITIFAGIFLILTSETSVASVESLTKPDGSPLVAPMDFGTFVTALIAAFYAFTGFESVASGASDMKNPQKNLPRAIPLAIGIIALVYFGIILVAMNINPTAMVTSKDVVVLASVFENPLIAKVIIYGAFVSMFGINVAASFHTPRLVEAMANEGQIPALFGKRNKAGLPLNAFLLTAVFAIVIPMAFEYSMRGIMIISSISRFVQFVLVPVAVILFFYGKSKEAVLDAPKSFLTDVVFSVLSLVLTLLLLVKFNWVGQFSKVVDGVSVANWYAITAMVLGYVVLPIFVYKFNKRSLK